MRSSQWIMSFVLLIFVFSATPACLAETTANSDTAGCYRQGMKAFLAGDYETAASLFGDAVRADSKYADAYYMEARSLLEANAAKNGYVILSCTVVRNVLTESDFVSVLYRNDATAFAALGLLNRAAELGDSSLECLYYSGLIYESTGNPEQALLTYHKIRKANPQYLLDRKAVNAQQVSAAEFFEYLGGNKKPDTASVYYEELEAGLPANIDDLYTKAMKAAVSKKADGYGSPDPQTKNSAQQKETARQAAICDAWRCAGEQMFDEYNKNPGNQYKLKVIAPDDCLLSANLLLIKHPEIISEGWTDEGVYHVVVKIS